LKETVIAGTATCSEWMPPLCSTKSCTLSPRDTLLLPTWLRHTPGRDTKFAPKRMRVAVFGRQTNCHGVGEDKLVASVNWDLAAHLSWEKQSAQILLMMESVNSDLVSFRGTISINTSAFLDKAYPALKHPMLSPMQALLRIDLASITMQLDTAHAIERMAVQVWRGFECKETRFMTATRDANGFLFDETLLVPISLSVRPNDSNQFAQNTITFKLVNAMGLHLFCGLLDISKFIDKTQLEATIKEKFFVAVQSEALATASDQLIKNDSPELNAHVRLLTNTEEITEVLNENERRFLSSQEMESYSSKAVSECRMPLKKRCSVFYGNLGSTQILT